MDLSDVFRALIRRWYVTIPLVLLSVALAAVSFFQVSPSWERHASLVLLPSRESVPDEGNPYLYLSGLTNVADVLTRASSSQESLAAIDEDHPGTTVEIQRDPTTSSPMLAIVTTASEDDDAAAAMNDILASIERTLDSLQAEEGLAPSERITIVPLSVDDEGTKVQKTRLLIAAVALGGGLVLALLVPAAVEGISRARQFRRASGKRMREGDQHPSGSHESRSPKADNLGPSARQAASEPGLRRSGQIHDRTR